MSFPPPFGAVYQAAGVSRGVQNVNQQHLQRGAAQSNGGLPVVATGRQLARLFENETPGLLYRHALNYLFYKRPEISPPRQARVWMMLDLAIFSALAAARHYKWSADPTAYAYRQRPVEYDQGASFKGLFDTVVGDDGDGEKCARLAPNPSPGTERSPSYASAHSAYATAATEILAYFFSEEREELERLANNIGTAQLWAGVHRRSDHAAGRRLGRAVARRVIEQIVADCVPAFDDPAYSLPGSPAPDPSALRRRSTARRAASSCPGAGRNDILPGQRRNAFEDCG